MSAFRRLACSVLVALAALIAVPGLASASAILTAAPATVDFPDTGIDDQAQRVDVKVSNSGDEEATVGSLLATSGPFWVDSNASDCEEVGTLQAGGSCNIAVIFAPLHPGLYA